MFTNQSLTSSVTSSVPGKISEKISAEISESLQQKLAGAPRLDTVDQTLGLPTTARSFIWTVLAVALICAGMSLLVATSIQTFQTRQLIGQLREQQQRIERQNADVVWQISQYTELNQVRQRAIALGYEAPSVRNYVVNQGDATPSSALVVATGATGHSQPQVVARPDLGEWFQQQIRLITSWWQN